MPPAAAGVLAAAGWVAACAWAWRAYWVDDAFIAFRYAANLGAGHGLVFNPGERVEGISNLGWALVLAATGARDLPATAKALGLALALATLLLTAATARRLAAAGPGAAAGPPAWLLVAPLPLLIAASPDWLYFSLAGMETALVSALVALALWAAARGAWRWPPAAACAALVLVRPEAVLVWPLAAAALAVGRRAGWRELAAPGALVAAAAGSLTLARLAYYGEPLPNTFYAKSPTAADLGGRLLDVATGNAVNLPSPLAGLPLLAFGGYGLLVLWRRAAPAAAFVLAAIATGAAFAVYAPDDWTGMGRFAAPYLPAGWLALWWGLAAGLERLFGGGAAGDGPGRAGSSRGGRGAGLRGRAVAAATVAIALVLAAAGVRRAARFLDWDAAHARPGYILTSSTLQAPARRIAAEVPPGATIATRRLGVLGYATGRRLFDWAFGLTEREVARAIRRRGRIFDDPRAPELAGPWRRAAPEWLVEDLDLLEERLGPGESLDGFEIHGATYRVVRRYPIGDGRSFWALCRRAGGPGPG